MAALKGRVVILFVGMLLASVFGLASCGSGSAGGSSAGSESSFSMAVGSSASEASADAQTNLAEEDGLAEEGDLAEEAGPGTPWVATFETGSLPEEAPDVKDDLYTHYNYDYIASHQGKDITQIASHQNEIKDYALATIKDESKTGHDLEQMRILFNQASDVEALKREGLSGLQPYLDQIDKAESIAQLNEVLASDEFPFSP